MPVIRTRHPGPKGGVDEAQVTIAVHRRQERELECWFAHHLVEGPRFSLDALAKTLNHLHTVCTLSSHLIYDLIFHPQIPRKPYLGKQISVAYDAYLAITHEVDLRVNFALKRPDGWYMKNVCPHCDVAGDTPQGGGSKQPRRGSPASSRCIRNG